MTYEEMTTKIGDVLGGVTEDLSDYDTRVKLMNDKHVTSNVVKELDDTGELTPVINNILKYQNEDLSEDELEILYEWVDEKVYGALRKLYPYVEEITDSSTGWDKGVFTKYLQTL